ncbi:GntR family transcriptional regulator [Saccharopolyspora sp. 5N102]|uniref:GntR family transcriptional regulator n=1 Tax=Saccharopolyspora sp. 5N102 TaxID=3375155 RepID=UPI00378AA143
MEHSNPGLAAYQRVVEAIKREIQAGTLSPGDRLPGNRAVAEKYDVALGTAQKALRALQDEGWLTSTPSVGVFVSGRLPSDEDAVDVPKALAELKSEIVNLAKRVEELERRS